MTIITNTSRIGNFSSSKIAALTKKDRSGKGFGVPAMTYIEEKRMERKLGRSLSTETNARATSWGKLCEPIAYSRLGFDYELVSNETLVHPDYPFWVGSPDLLAYPLNTPRKVGDIKCPATLKSFCQFADCMTEPDPIASIRENHPDGETYYWQLVSNAILTDTQYAELIVFCPYREDLAEIRLTAMDDPKYRWVEYAEDWELPFLIIGMHYNDIYTFLFEVPQSDIDLLTDCVDRAGKLLFA
jgi:hypothetical protein